MALQARTISGIEVAAPELGFGLIPVTFVKNFSIDFKHCKGHWQKQGRDSRAANISFADNLDCRAFVPGSYLRPLARNLVYCFLIALALEPAVFGRLQICPFRQVNTWFIGSGSCHCQRQQGSKDDRGKLHY